MSATLGATGESACARECVFELMSVAAVFEVILNPSEEASRRAPLRGNEAEVTGG